MGLDEVLMSSFEALKKNAKVWSNPIGSIYRVAQPVV